jgi:hypothetical protein
MKLMPVIATAAASIAFTVALLHGKEEPEADAVVPVYAVKEIETSTAEEDAKLLNAMAKEGWELQQVIVVLSMVNPFEEGPPTVRRFYFKRAL